MRRVLGMCICVLVLLAVGAALAAPHHRRANYRTRPAVASARTTPATAAPGYRPDIVVAVKATAGKDCGCGACAAKGCAPCKGKNCYFCVSKALVAQECGCGMCGANGCTSCGPGCDVCKFHLAPVAEAKAGGRTANPGAAAKSAAPGAAMKKGVAK